MVDFSAESFGKFIVAGEHSVLRGAPALVFPLKSKSLKISFQSDPQSSFQTKFGGTCGADLQLLFCGVLHRSEELLGFAIRDQKKARGVLTIESDLPIGAGLGASAALCVAVARFLVYLDLLNDQDVAQFARNLENLFHGESSGVDVAVAVSGTPLVFEKVGRRDLFVPRWQPRWYLSYSGQRGLTKECVDKVKAWMMQNPVRGQELDLQMADSVAGAMSELQQNSNEKSLKNLVQAMNAAGQCFVEWGLVSDQLMAHMNQLKQAGALAVKPTGSGGGGYALSLWDQQPPENLLPDLISCF
jgi:mevalonate kinase